MIRKFGIKEPFNKLFKVNIGVPSRGIFACTIPKDISDLFSEHGIELKPNRCGNMGYYNSETLAGLCNLLKKDIEILCSENLKEHKFSDGRMDDPIDWLSSITSHSPGNFKPKEMDYTPERGMFFVNLYKSIFRINEQIKPFLKENLLEKAIDSKMKFLN